MRTWETSTYFVRSSQKMDKNWLGSEKEAREKAGYRDLGPPRRCRAERRCRRRETLWRWPCGPFAPWNRAACGTWPQSRPRFCPTPERHQSFSKPDYPTLNGVHQNSLGLSTFYKESLGVNISFDWSKFIIFIELQWMNYSSGFSLSYAECKGLHWIIWSSIWS